MDNSKIMRFATNLPVISYCSSLHRVFLLFSVQRRLKERFQRENGSSTFDVDAQSRDDHVPLLKRHREPNVEDRLKRYGKDM